MRLGMWRYIFWIVFVGLIGAIIKSKAAIVSMDDVLLGFLVGGCLGYLIAAIFDLKKRQ